MCSMGEVATGGGALRCLGSDSITASVPAALVGKGFDVAGTGQVPTAWIAAIDSPSAVRAYVVCAP